MRHACKSGPVSERLLLWCSCGGYFEQSSSHFEAKAQFPICKKSAPYRAVVGDMGTATGKTARGCARSLWPRSGAERWNYRQSGGEDDRKRGIRGYDGGKRTLGRKGPIV